MFNKHDTTGPERRSAHIGMLHDPRPNGGAHHIVLDLLPIVPKLRPMRAAVPGVTARRIFHCRSELEKNSGRRAGSPTMTNPSRRTAQLSGSPGIAAMAAVDEVYVVGCIGRGRDAGNQRLVLFMDAETDDSPCRARG